MSVEHVEIDSDEGGWLLVLDTDGNFGVDVERASFSFRLPGDQAVALMEEVKQKIRPWHVEGESVRHDHERYKRTGEVPDYVPKDRLDDGAPLAPRREEGGADDDAPPSHHAGYGEEERAEARRIANEVWGFVERHEQEQHDGETCAENRISILAFFAHCIGLRPFHAHLIEEALEVYERAHEHRNGR